MAQVNNKRTKRAFTLVEAVIGMAVVALVLASIFQLQAYSLLVTESARNESRVTQMLQHQMENLRATRWDDFVNLEGQRVISVNKEGIPIADDSFVSEGVVPFSWRAFRMTQSITPVKAGQYNATLLVEWIDGQGRSKARTFVTLFTEGGLNEYYTRSI